MRSWNRRFCAGAHHTLDRIYLFGQSLEPTFLTYQRHRSPPYSMLLVLLFGVGSCLQYKVIYSLNRSPVHARSELPNPRGTPLFRQPWSRQKLRGSHSKSVLYRRSFALHWFWTRRKCSQNLCIPSWFRVGSCLENRAPNDHTSIFLVGSRLENFDGSPSKSREVWAVWDAIFQTGAHQNYKGMDKFRTPFCTLPETVQRKITEVWCQLAVGSDGLFGVTMSAKSDVPIGF